MYTKILDLWKHPPKHVAYGKYTDQITSQKLGTIKEEPDVKKLKDLRQGGEVEEVILQAENKSGIAMEAMGATGGKPPADRWSSQYDHSV